MDYKPARRFPHQGLRAEDFRKTRLSSQAAVLYEHRPAACGIQFLANRGRRGPLLRLCNWLDSSVGSDNNSNSNKRRVRPYRVPYILDPLGEILGSYQGGKKGRRGTGMADSYAALLLGMGSPALAESGRCVEDCFLYLFVVLIRPCWEGLCLLYGEESLWRGAEVIEETTPLPVILNREDGGGFPSHIGDYPVCHFESSIPHRYASFNTHQQCQLLYLLFP